MSKNKPATKKIQKTHRIEELRIKLKSYDVKMIDQAVKKILDVAEMTKTKSFGPVPLPTHRELFTVIRPTHKFKDSREQFELRTHKRLIGFVKPKPEAIDKLERLILPIGVSLEIRTVSN